MIAYIKDIIDRLFCHHEWENTNQEDKNLSPDRLNILICKKCNKIRFEGGYQKGRGDFKNV